MTVPIIIRKSNSPMSTATVTIRDIDGVRVGFTRADFQGIGIVPGRDMQPMKV